MQLGISFRANPLQKLSLAGRSSSSPENIKNKREFIGTYIKDAKGDTAHDLRRAIANYIPQDPPCDYFRETGLVLCSGYCAEDAWEGIMCPETEFWRNRRALSRVESQIPLVWAFRDPTLAEGNDLFDEELFYSHA